MKTQALQDALIEMVSAALEVEKANRDVTGFEARITTTRLELARTAFGQEFEKLLRPQPEIPEWVRPFPKVPDGYARWEYRGFGLANKDRGWIAYACKSDPSWSVRRENALGCKHLIYLEAVK